MFKPEEMVRQRAVVLEEDLADVVEALHAEPLVEVEDTANHEDVKGFVEACKASENAKWASFNLSVVRKIDSFLHSFDAQKSLRQRFVDAVTVVRPRKERVPVRFEEVRAFVRETLDKLNPEVAKLEEGLRLLAEREAEAKREMEALEAVKGFGLDVGLLHGYEYLSVFVVRVPKELEPVVLEAVRGASDSHFVKFIGEKERIGLVAVSAGDEAATVRALNGAGAERISVPETTGDAEKLLKGLHEELETIAESRGKLVGKVKELKEKHAERLRVLDELLAVEKDKWAAHARFGKTEKTTVVSYWVPAAKEAEAQARVEKASGKRCFVEAVPFKDEDAPTKLNNFFGYRNYEYLLKLFGVPRYNEFDPTVAMALFYPLFFGLALGDMAYGLMLLAMTFFLRKTIGKKDPGIKQFSTVLVHSALFTIFFGWLFGSFFGNLLYPMVQPVVVHSIKLDPFDEVGITLFLGAALLLGVLQINLALAIGFIEDARKGLWKNALIQKGRWMALELSAVLLGGSSLWGWGDVALYAGVVAGVLTMALLFLADGPLGLLGLSGFMGIVLSYTRLLALGLSTGAIALALNVIGGMFAGIPFLGLPLMALFLVVTHLANFGFNVLGSFVHALRLHFVEFFGFFYEGSGRLFEAYHTPRVYTRTGGGT